jgi:unsaturated rhamnogalacturonyl hydrolase
VTGDTHYLDLLKARIDEYMELGLPKPWNVNRCAMGHCLLSLYEATGEQKYLDVAADKVDYLEHDALRFGDHVLQHTVSASNDFPEQCWADTLFMAAFFLLRYGVIAKDETVIEDALNQYYWHIHYLQNPETGLWYHGYSNKTGDHMSGFYGGRANAWAAYPMSRVGRVLPKAYLYPQYMDVCGSLDELLSSVKLLQTENGLWRTILDDPESYEEVSASCGIAAAMETAGNPLQRKYVDLALQGIAEQISPDGRVLNVSAGTAVMKDREGYRRISRSWIQGWGQGLALAFFAQILERTGKGKDGE